MRMKWNNSVCWTSWIYEVMKLLNRFLISRWGRKRERKSRGSSFQLVEWCSTFNWTNGALSDFLAFALSTKLFSIGHATNLLSFCVWLRKASVEISSCNVFVFETMKERFSRLSFTRNHKVSFRAFAIVGGAAIENKKIGLIWFSRSALHVRVTNNSRAPFVWWEFHR